MYYKYKDLSDNCIVIAGVISLCSSGPLCHLQPEELQFYILEFQIKFHLKRGPTAKLFVVLYIYIFL